MSSSASKPQLEFADLKDKTLEELDAISAEYGVQHLFNHYLLNNIRSRMPVGDDRLFNDLSTMDNIQLFHVAQAQGMTDFVEQAMENLRRAVWDRSDTSDPRHPRGRAPNGLDFANPFYDSSYGTEAEPSTSSSSSTSPIASSSSQSPSLSSATSEAAAAQATQAYEATIETNRLVTRLAQAFEREIANVRRCLDLQQSEITKQSRIVGWMRSAVRTFAPNVAAVADRRVAALAVPTTTRARSTAPSPPPIPAPPPLPTQAPAPTPTATPAPASEVVETIRTVPRASDDDDDEIVCLGTSISISAARSTSSSVTAEAISSAMTAPRTTSSAATSSSASTPVASTSRSAASTSQSTDASTSRRSTRTRSAAYAPSSGSSRFTHRLRSGPRPLSRTYAFYENLKPDVFFDPRLQEKKAMWETKQKVRRAKRQRKEEARRAGEKFEDSEMEDNESSTPGAGPSTLAAPSAKAASPSSTPASPTGSKRSRDSDDDGSEHEDSRPSRRARIPVSVPEIVVSPPPVNDTAAPAQSTSSADASEPRSVRQRGEERAPEEHEEWHGICLTSSSCDGSGHSHSATPLTLSSTFVDPIPAPAPSTPAPRTNASSSATARFLTPPTPPRRSSRAPFHRSPTPGPNVPALRRPIAQLLRLNTTASSSDAEVDAGASPVKDKGKKRARDDDDEDDAAASGSSSSSSSSPRKKRNSKEAN